MKARITPSICLALSLLLCAVSCRRSPAPDEARKAILDSVFIPRPTEIFTAMSRVENVNWGHATSYNTETDYAFYEQIALNLGFRVADSFVAIMAEDRDRMNDMGNTIITLAEKIGVDREILKKDFDIKSGEKALWKKYEKDFNNIYTNVIMDLEKRKDYEMSFFFNLGAWLKALQIACGVLTNNYSVQTAQLLRQKAVADSFIEGYRELPPSSLKKSSVSKIGESLPEIARLIDVRRGAPVSRENIMALYRISMEIMKEVERNR
jgi:hypothetical protein